MGMAGVQELIYELNHAETAGERVAAALELGRTYGGTERERDALNALSAAARFSEHITVRRASAYALGALGSPDAAETLFGLLLEEDGWLRGRAVRALARIVSENGLPEGPSRMSMGEIYVPVLARMLGSQNENIGRAAARVLSHAGSRNGLDALLDKAASGDGWCASMLLSAGPRSMEPLYHIMFAEGGSHAPDMARFSLAASALTGVLERADAEIEYDSVSEYADEMYPGRIASLKESIYSMLGSEVVY